MTNGSPGRHSNQAFSIGSDTVEADSFLEDSFLETSNPFQSDPMCHLINHTEDETPLIIPVEKKFTRQMTQHPDETHLVVDVFCVNEEDKTWRQASRFARYEEDCEGFDNHFGKPHVPFLSMATYHALQKITPKSIILPEYNYSTVHDFTNDLETLVVDPDVPNLGSELAELVRTRIQTLESARPLSKMNSSSTQSLNQPVKSSMSRLTTPGGIKRSLLSAPNNLNSMGALNMQPKKLPPVLSGLRFKGSFLSQQPSQQRLEPVIWDEANEVSMLVTGVVPGISVCRLIVVEFAETISMQQVFPKQNNIRHIFFLIGPPLEEMEFLNLGRALASVISNPNCIGDFEHLRSADSITRAVERFLSETVVIAPGRIDNKNLVAGDLIRKLVNMQAEKHAQHTPQHVHPANIDIEYNAPKDKELANKQSDCWFFSGVISDLKNRANYYMSDFKDGFNVVILTVVIYMFCVTVVPTLTFGAILSLGTDGILAVKECLIGQAICGIIWSFFSCQPLLIMSPTGPFLVFEKALYQFTKSRQLDFLEVRLYTGIFLLIIAICGSTFNIARLIRYVTIYTEDIFCALISLIFFFEVYEFLELQYHHNEIKNLAYYVEHAANCTGVPIENCHLNRPNTFLLELMMVIGSIAVFHYLRQISRSSFFGRTFRNLCGNFGGSFAVVVVTGLYHAFFKNVQISMVDIPEHLGEQHEHGLVVIPDSVPSGETLIVAAIAAPLLFVLLFVETEIPQQMALRESRKLKKGGGLHWDLIVAGICTVVCSIMGLPWQCPAAVQSLAHITALTVYKKSAPGEPSRAAGVIEQRFSGLITYIMLLIFSIVGHFFEIPSAAIFGVFFYLGVRNLNGNMMLMRVKMWFLLAKYRGNHKFLDLAPFYVIGFYTFIQCTVLGLMFAAKSTQIGGLLFPMMLVACSLFVNKFLPLVFTKDLLEALDGEDVEEAEVDNDNEENPVDFYYNTRIPV